MKKKLIEYAVQMIIFILVLLIIYNNILMKDQRLVMKEARETIAKQRAILDKIEQKQQKYYIDPSASCPEASLFEDCSKNLSEYKELLSQCENKLRLSGK